MADLLGWRTSIRHHEREFEMGALRSRRIVLAGRPRGMIGLENFRVEDVTLPSATDGQVLVETNYLSLDPYMRGRMDDRKSYATPTPVGGVMEAESVATVLESRHPSFVPGDTVTARTGRASHAPVAADAIRHADTRFGPRPPRWAFSGCRGLQPMRV